jgi:erythromycin esterase
MRRVSALVLVLAGCSNAPTPPTDQNPGPTLPAGVTLVSSLEPGRPIDDLAPLQKIVGDASVVGLGESIHTSGGFSLVKARLFRYLVEAQGFRVLAMEVPRADADFASAYVMTDCSAGGTEAARHLGVWADDNTRDMLDWMCNYNRTRTDAADKVHFFGFDIAQPWADAPMLRQFLVAAVPSDVNQVLNEGIAKCDGVDATSADDYQSKYGLSKPIAKADNDACLAGIQAIADYFTANEAAISGSTSPDALAEARIDLASFRGWQQERFYMNVDPVQLMNTRDTTMAQIFDQVRALHFPSLRAVVWADDDHVSLDHAAAKGTGADGATSMGTQLAGQLGPDYVAIGLTGWDVEINWPGVGCGPQKQQPAIGSVEASLHALGQPYLLVDLTTHGQTAAPFFAAGSSYGFAVNETLVPAAQWNALLYLDQSLPMNSLLWQCQ